MQPLPANPYEPSLWSDQTVLLDYTVTDGLNKYSVPYDLMGNRSASVLRAIQWKYSSTETGWLSIQERPAVSGTRS